YILDSEGRFGWNFGKGAMGLWLRLCIIMGIAVTCSTYLSGVIGWLVTMVLYVFGFFQEYVQSLAEGTNIGGGPMESFLRLVQRESLVTPLQITPGTQLAVGSDEIYRWIMRRVLNIIPYVDQFDWTNYVAEGFNIGIVEM